MSPDAGPLPHQVVAAEQLMQIFSASDMRLCIVAGTSGSGKTWLATHALLAVEEPQLKPAQLVVQGQHTFQGTPLACWRLALHGRRSRYARSHDWHDLTNETMKAASKVTLGLSELVTVIVGTSKRFRKGPLTLSDQQFEILHELAALAGSTPLVVIADDLQWWDDDSLVLLRAMFLDAFVRAYPFLKHTRVIAVLRSDTDRTPSVTRLLDDLRPPAVSLDLPDLAATKTALNVFGVRDLEDATVKALFAATGGHLQLIQEAARYVLSKSDSSLLAGESAGWSIERQADFLRKMISERLAHSGLDPTAMTELLEAAATIGIAFSEASLNCMLRDYTDPPKPAISALLSMGLLERNGAVLRFAHEILQYASTAPVASRGRELHRRLADCLRILNPSDYATRAVHFLLAGDHRQASAFQTLALLANVQRGTHQSALTIASDDAADVTLQEASSILQSAVRSWLDNDYTRVVELLANFPADVPEVLGAERTYLVADSLLKSLEASTRSAALDLLQQWLPRMADEFDLWFRLNTSLMVGYAHLNDIAAARAAEREIVQAIDARRIFDPDAQDYIFTLYRKSDAVHEIEIVVRRQQEAVNFFRGRSATTMPRHPAEYARSAANLIGTLTVLGDYQSARNQAQELVRWLSDMPPAVLPRATVALNNSLLAELLSGDGEPKQIAAAFETLNSEALRTEDKLLIQNNLAVVLIHADQCDRSIQLLEECQRSLEALYSPDPYYVYFIRSNLFGLQLCYRLLPDAEAQWQSLSGMLSYVHQPLRPFLERRHVLLANALNAAGSWDIAAWDGYIAAHAPRQLGHSWSFYGRGFLLSDIQHWSDG